MIGFRERERTRETRRLYWAKAAIFFLWVILVFALISLFLSIHNENSNRSSSRRNLAVNKPPPLQPQREYSFRKTLFHASPSSSSTNTTTTQAQFVSTNNGDQNNTLYGDEKRIIHTGPNPLHN